MLAYRRLNRGRLVQQWFGSGCLDMSVCRHLDALFPFGFGEVSTGLMNGHLLSEVDGFCMTVLWT